MAHTTCRIYSSPIAIAKPLPHYTKLCSLFQMASNIISLIVLLLATIIGCNAGDGLIGNALSRNLTLEESESDLVNAPNSPSHDDTKLTIASNSLCLKEHNAERARNGKPALSYNSQLDQAAIKHNQVMSSQKCFSHKCSGEPDLGTRVSNTGYRWSGVAENIAAGQSDCRDVMNSWMNSSGHKANILGNYKHVGCDKNGKYWTCVFGNQ